jgi:hypothetical protein
MEIHVSIEIVRKALGAVGQSGDVSPESALGELIPNEAERDQFREAIRKHVQAKNFKIRRESIPVYPHTTLGDLTRTIAMAALPGDPYIPKPDEEPPPPPRPKAVRPKMDKAKYKEKELN